MFNLSALERLLRIESVRVMKLVEAAEAPGTALAKLFEEEVVPPPPSADAGGPEP